MENQISKNRLELITNHLSPIFPYDKSAYTIDLNKIYENQNFDQNQNSFSFSNTASSVELIRQQEQHVISNVNDPTPPKFRLTPVQKSFYETNGFFVVKGIFNQQELDEWKNRLHDVITGKTDTAKQLLVMKDVQVAKKAAAPKSRSEEIAKVQDLWNDPVFMKYIAHEKLLNWVEKFLESGDIKAVHTMLINKPPGLENGRHPLHQDLQYFPFRPTNKIVATWTALETVNRENGCLSVVPGTHLHETLYEHKMPDWKYTNMGYFGVAGANANTPRVHLEMDPGDTVFFHPLLLHGSGRNLSNGFRRAISTHYASGECRYKQFFHQDYDFILSYNKERERKYVLVRGKQHNTPDAI